MLRLAEVFILLRKSEAKYLKVKIGQSIMYLWSKIVKVKFNIDV